MHIGLQINYFQFYVLEENIRFLEIYTMNCETIRKMVRSVNETYLNILLSIPKCDFDTNKVSALSNFSLHPLRFIGTRLDCRLVCYLFVYFLLVLSDFNQQWLICGQFVTRKTYFALVRKNYRRQHIGLQYACMLFCGVFFIRFQIRLKIANQRPLYCLENIFCLGT